MTPVHSAAHADRVPRLLAEWSPLDPWIRVELHLLGLGASTADSERLPSYRGLSKNSENSEPCAVEIRRIKAHAHPCARFLARRCDNSAVPPAELHCVEPCCHRSRAPKMRPADFCNSDCQRRVPVQSVPTGDPRVSPRRIGELRGSRRRNPLWLVARRLTWGVLFPRSSLRVASDVLS